jgi:hypothetical protein
MCNLDHAVNMAVVELNDDNQAKKLKLKTIKSLFKIAICPLRSPMEVRMEPGIDAMVSPHIKRDSLRNIVDQLFSSGSAVQPTSRHIPYSYAVALLILASRILGKTNPFTSLWLKITKSYNLNTLF